LELSVIKSRFNILTCFLLGLPKLLIASKDSLRLKMDSIGDIQLRTFPSHLTERYTDQEFKYDQNYGESKNLLDEFFNWLSHWLKDLFQVDLAPVSAENLKIIVYCVLGAFAIFLLIKFFMKEKSIGLLKKSDHELVDINLSEIHIEEFDLDKNIEQAVRSDNYRLAIRYQYLKVLKTLSLQNFIEWHFDKTNSDYISEIKRDEIKEEFKQLSYIYEHVWYGGHEIDATTYDRTNSNFTLLFKIINQ